MKVYRKTRITFLLSFLAFSLLLANCAKKSKNPFSDRDADVKDNIENLMGLSVGMTKQQVFGLSGVSNYVEGYDWGSVWFYKIRKGGTNEGPLANKDIEQLYMPVVFDNTDRVMGYGRKFYDQTLSDLGTGQF
jgi:outer membrane protein assembly factor BamE (lipoprotein component of BamABCDE complex)|tara:strand:+ start:131 stop:529 length:399 start_codon:yes stop_codon:yes gene_type:complete